MITHTAGAVKYVNRTWGIFPDNTSDWTMFIRFRYPTNVPSAYAAVANLFDGATDYTTPYLYLGSTSGGGDDLLLEVFDGTNYLDTPTVAVVIGDQNWAAITHDESSSTLTLIVNGVTIGSISVDLSALGIVWDSVFLLGDTAAGGLSQDVSAGYFRAWSRVLSGAELTAEAASALRVSTEGLLWDNPCQAGIDLTDHNGGFNHLAGISFTTQDVTTDDTDPFVSVVASPPTNTTTATAIEITLDSLYMQNTNTAANVAAEVWHKITATRDETWGFCYYGNESNYFTWPEVFEGLTAANALDYYLDIGNSANDNRPLQFPVTAGNTYYFKCKRATSGSHTFTLHVSAIRALDLDVPAGSIAVSDDARGYTSAFLDLTTGYPLKFVRLPAIGEGGNVLADGTFILTNGDGANGDAIVFASDNSIIAIVSLLADSPFYDEASSNGRDTFLVGTTSANPSRLRLISAGGVLSPTIFNLGAVNGTFGVGLSASGSVAYYHAAGGSGSDVVKSWDLTNNIALPDFAAAIADYQLLHDILGMQDGTVVVPRSKLVLPRHYTIIHYDAAGAVLHTYDFGLDGHAHNRVFSAIDDPLSFWTWIKGHGTHPDAISTFQNVRVSDGAILSTRDAMQYESGIYVGVYCSTPPRFGHSESCPAWIVRAPIIETETSPNPNAPTWKLIGVDIAYQRLKGLRNEL